MLSIVIPCYNGAILIKKSNIEKVYSFVKELTSDFEIIVVNDGSTDNSLDLLSELDKKNGLIKIVSYEQNMGKGYAIKQGILASHGDVLFMDIDLSTDLEAIKDIINSSYIYDILIGSRNVKGSLGGQDKSFLRNSMSFVSNFLVRKMFGLTYKDTQCGFKFMRKDTALFLAEKQQIYRWAFDVEYLYIAKKYNLEILEIPVKWKDDLNSSVSPIKASMNFLKDLFKIFMNKKKY